MNTSRKGSAKELRTAAILESDGWIVGSRRHTPGPGDLTANKSLERPMLLEVKSTAGGPYERFGPVSRESLRLAADAAGMVAVLAWWAPRAKTHRLIPEPEWPSTRVHTLGRMAS